MTTIGILLSINMWMSCTALGLAIGNFLNDRNRRP